MKVQDEPRESDWPSFVTVQLETRRRMTRTPGLAVLSQVWASVSSHRATHHRLLVSPFVFACCWWFIVGMHFFNGTLALIFSALYLFFNLSAVYPTVAIVGISLSMMKVSGWAYAVLAAVHWIALVRMVHKSIRARGLTMSSQTKQIQPRNQIGRAWRALVGNTWENISMKFWRPWNRLFGVEGIFGVNGAHFHSGFVARETLEVGLQTYQAYQLSRCVRRDWITNLAVAIIFLNSVSTPFVYFVLRGQKESARRFLSVLVDMTFDFCCAAIIPICVVYPYVTSYNLAIGSMPINIINNDVLFASSLEEIRQFCVTSMPDFLATMMPHATVFSWLNLAKTLVQKDQQGDGVSAQVKKAAATKRLSMKIVDSHNPSSLDQWHCGATNGFYKPTIVRASHRAHFGFHALMIAWSIFVLSVHVQASSYVEGSPGIVCRLSFRTWGAVGAPCSVMQINCYRARIVGSFTEIASILNPLDRSVLRKLIITHCSALEILQILGEFQELADLDLYNSTLIQWPMEAAATSKTLRSLTNFNWFASDFVTFPHGLLHDDMPKGFSRFSIARSNVTRLPDNLGELWRARKLDLFSLQFTQVERLPSSFAMLKIRKLRLVSNKLKSIDENILAPMNLVALQLSGNPLKTWPNSIGDTSELVLVLAEYTEVSHLSEQLKMWWSRRARGLFAHHTFSLFGSPVCKSDDESLGMCDVDHGNANGTYRWDLIEPQRSLDM